VSARLLGRLEGVRLLSSQAKAGGCWLSLVDDCCVFFPLRWEEEEAGVLAPAFENFTS